MNGDLPLSLLRVILDTLLFVDDFARVILDTLLIVDDFARVILDTLLFVDDFAWFAWIYLLKHKCNVLSTFKHFKALMENQFLIKIKILRKRYGGEYTKNEFEQFCSSNGIFHHHVLTLLNRME